MLGNNCTVLPGQAKDLAGQAFGRWTVLEYIGKRGSSHYWRCTCLCGSEKGVSGYSLTSGLSQSCGCLIGERARQRSTSHGRTKTTEYRIWQNMLRRCGKKGFHAYDRYGGRGITVCQRWMDSFEAFFEDMGERPKGLSLERKNNNGNYEPNNCCWATPTEQARNRRSSRFLTLNGVTKLLVEWAEERGMARGTLKERIRKGWSIEEAITIPVGPRSR